METKRINKGFYVQNDIRRNNTRIQKSTIFKAWRGAFGRFAKVEEKLQNVYC